MSIYARATSLPDFFLSFQQQHQVQHKPPTPHKMARSNNTRPNMEMTDLNNKLSSMNIEEDSSEQRWEDLLAAEISLVLNISRTADHMSTNNAHSSGAQARKIGGGRKKKQWKKLDMASGKIVPELREQTSTSGRKLYKYGPPTCPNQDRKVLLTVLVVLPQLPSILLRYFPSSWGWRFGDMQLYMHDLLRSREVPRSEMAMISVKSFVLETNIAAVSPLLLVNLRYVLNLRAPCHLLPSPPS
jgi:hypothetical protein